RVRRDYAALHRERDFGELHIGMKNRSFGLVDQDSQSTGADIENFAADLALGRERIGELHAKDVTIRNRKAQVTSPLDLEDLVRPVKLQAAGVSAFVGGLEEDVRALE